MSTEQKNLIDFLDKVLTQDDPELDRALSQRSPEKVIELMKGDSKFEGHLEAARQMFGASGCEMRQRRKTLHDALTKLLKRRRDVISRMATA